MGIIFSKEKNALIEIRFPKEFWSKAGVNRFVKLYLLDQGMVLDDDIYSQYYKSIYRDIRRYKNIRTTTDVRDHIIFVYGDGR
jgi:hypothetical protein